MNQQQNEIKKKSNFRMSRKEITFEELKISRKSQKRYDLTKNRFHHNSQSQEKSLYHLKK